MEVPALEVRGSSRDSKALLNPLALEVEPVEMGFPSKKCEALLLDSENQSEESGRKGSWGGRELRKESRVVVNWEEGIPGRSESAGREGEAKPRRDGSQSTGGRWGRGASEEVEPGQRERRMKNQGGKRLREERK